MRLYLVPVKDRHGGVRFNVFRQLSSRDQCIGDVTEEEHGWAVLHHSSDLSYDGVDTLHDALTLLRDIHREHSK